MRDPSRAALTYDSELCLAFVSAIGTETAIVCRWLAKVAKDTLVVPSVEHSSRMWNLVYGKAAQIKVVKASSRVWF